MAAFETTLAPVALSPIIVQAEALGVGQEQMQTFLLPVEASTHPLYNPDIGLLYLSEPAVFLRPVPNTDFACNRLCHRQRIQVRYNPGLASGCHTRRKRPRQSAKCRHPDCCCRKAVALTPLYSQS